MKLNSKSIFLSSSTTFHSVSELGTGEFPTNSQVPSKVGSSPPQDFFIECHREELDKAFDNNAPPALVKESC